MTSDLDKIFESFNKNAIFKNKFILQSNYQPSEILYRDEQIEQIASILAPVLRGERPSNLFLYGQTGTGKTLSMQYVKNELLKRIKKNSDFKLKIIYLNCKLKKVSDTEYRILAEIIRKLDGKVPDTGLPTEAVYNKFIDIIDLEKQLIILILDEIDQTVKKISDNFLYNLTRLNSELSKTQICIVGISNNPTFLEGIDARIKSSLSDEGILFPPYDAVQLKKILKKRADESFKKGVIEDGVIAKCAAFAARGHGDARRALDLLRIAGELAERDNSEKILMKHLDESNEKIERDTTLDLVKAAPKQFHLVLYSIIQLSQGKYKQTSFNIFPFNKNKNQQIQTTNSIFTGEVYNYYQKLCTQNKMEVLTQRRVGDIIQELDLQGVINVRVISKGRGGRMREIKLSVTDKVIEKIKEIIGESLNYD